MGAVNPHRGLVRLAVVLAVLWFVYWSFVYVLRPRAAENAPYSDLTLASPMGIALAIALIVGAVAGAAWVRAGLRPTWNRPRIDT